MLAAVGTGAYEDAWEAQRSLQMPEAEPVEPTSDPAVRAAYGRGYRVFSGLYPALKGLFGEGFFGGAGGDRQTRTGEDANTNRNVAAGALDRDA